MVKGLSYDYGDYNDKHEVTTESQMKNLDNIYRAIQRKNFLNLSREAAFPFENQHATGKNNIKLVKGFALVGN